MATVPLYTHTCWPKNAAGEECWHSEDVYPHEVASQTTCRVCKEPLATAEEIAAHLYEYLARE